MEPLQTFLRLIKRTLLFSLLVVQPINAVALTVEDVTFQESISIDNKQVPIRGVALLRWLKIFKVYVAALYLPENGSPHDVLANTPNVLK
ncbi:chalcone isomerase family protein [uncultured Desulfobulbus sp.]|uniref:chalcone isomerase family protein n=1 Tax=uncultured Desulfobulbus sp. TaxID=239745 RepID=UPI0029C937BD|nr:chalcone isomerase family protein [uncultured Desulfobulbus sp.]